MPFPSTGPSRGNTHNASILLYVGGKKLPLLQPIQDRTRGATSRQDFHPKMLQLCVCVCVCVCVCFEWVSEWVGWVRIKNLPLPLPKNPQENVKAAPSRLLLQSIFRTDPPPWIRWRSVAKQHSHFCTFVHSLRTPNFTLRCIGKVRQSGSQAWTWT